ncbi:MAG: ACP S-malonyltransferase [Polyangiaceae bacterium]|nr:ACP S-malonyltransferase [Polyangiaceae bacterium]
MMPRGTFEPIKHGMNAKVAWLFPGQGSQVVGMGKLLWEHSSKAREVFERADEALGRSISKLCFDGPLAELTLTVNTQPALVTTCIATLAALREELPELPAPVCVLGHSLGEYSALVAAGALTLEDAVRLVELRGRAMQEAVPAGKGGMAAIIGGDIEQVEALCATCAEGEVLSCANFNSPGQIVIAGTASAVARATKLAPELKLKAISLAVSAPFHCSLMQPAALAVEEALRSIHISAPSIPVIANVDALPNVEQGRVAQLLVSQVSSPVRWQQSVSKARELGVTAALEVGPGKVLAGLVKRIEKELRVLGLAEPSHLLEVAQFIA